MLSLSSILSGCLRRFNTLVTSNTLQHDVTDVSPDLWEDELGRLRVWAANIGAHRTGRSSLDYRLRDASNIRDQCIRLLNGVQRAFDDVEYVFQKSEEGHVPVEDESEPEDDRDSEVQQIFKGLVNTIDCLFQMSMVIRRSVNHDQFTGIKKADSAFFEPYDQRHVENKFPRAKQDIRDRLGTAISRRRAGLKYRERHREKLSKGLSSALGNQSETGSTVLSETVSTEFERSQLIQSDETASNSGVSETSYAQTLPESNARISIPPPPKESADGKPFECPYCFFVITVRDRRSWIRHVFTDLMPYVCVFPDCSTPTMLYAIRREWYHHLQTCHSVQAKQDAGFHCPLCQEEVTGGVRLDRHVGRHLEDLALFALPRTESEEDRTSAGAYPMSERFTDVPHNKHLDDDEAHIYSSADLGALQEGVILSSDAKADVIARLDESILAERAETKEDAVTRAETDRVGEERVVEPKKRKLRGATPEVEANEALERVASSVPTTAKPRGVAKTPKDVTWYCSECYDGPYGSWQPMCQACGHWRCLLCRA